MMKTINKITGIVLISFSFLVSEFLYTSIAETGKRPEVDSILKNTIMYPWKIPDESAMPQGMEGEYIKYGKQLIIETYKYLGPEVKDLKRRFAGNNLSCNNCHLDAGTKPFAAGYIGIYGRFPQYRTREDSIVTLENRINDCFERSLNGKGLPFDSKEMKSIIMYMKWLSSEIPVGAKVDGQGLLKIPLLSRAASPKFGKKVFMEKCISCHGIKGQGIRKGKVGNAEGYFFPPLWGKDSFNNGAGMHRLITAASFIKANMPLDNANLSSEQAFDVASYINSQERPEKPGLEKDFPVLGTKPVDAPYPPFNDVFTLEQHKYGPFQPMMK